MSSQKQPIQFSSLTMINRVLTRAGYRGTSAEVDAKDTSEAATYLLEKFHEGASSEDELVTLLDKRGRSPNPSDDTPAQVKAEALDRWQDEGGALSPDGTTPAEERGNANWSARSIGGAIGVGATIFLGPQGARSGGIVPELSDRIDLQVNGETWRYTIVSATGSQLGIQSRAHTLTLVPADAGHPARSEGDAVTEGSSAWIVAAVVSGQS
jgi:hypothetical protein